MGKRYTYLNVYEHSGGQAGINFYSFLATTIPVRCDAPCVRKRQRPLSASRFSTPLIIRIIIFLIFVVVIGDSSALVGIWPKIYRVAAITPIMFPWTTPFPSLAGRCCRLSIWSSARTLPPSPCFSLSLSWRSFLLIYECHSDLTRREGRREAAVAMGRGSQSSRRFAILLLRPLSQLLCRIAFR